MFKYLYHANLIQLAQLVAVLTRFDVTPILDDQEDNNRGEQIISVGVERETPPFVSKRKSHERKIDQKVP